jgi:hypothetical protein
MPQIGSADVTYAQLQGVASATPASPATELGMSIAFGNGTLTYTNGGIPLQKAKLGCPNVLLKLIMMDEASSTGYVPKFDYSNLKIRLYQNDTAAAVGQLVEVLTSAAVAAVTLKVLVEGY